MPIAKITGQGLAAIAFSVGLLWTSVIAGQVAQRAAVVERARIIREVRQLQQHRATPVLERAPFRHQRSYLTAG